MLTEMILAVIDLVIFLESKDPIGKPLIYSISKSSVLLSLITFCGIFISYCLILTENYDAYIFPVNLEVI